jgi:hypothetical protein
MPVHLALCLRVPIANQSSLGVSFPKLYSFRASFLQQNFCKPQWQVLFWALILEKIRITVDGTATDPAAAELPLPSVLPIVELSVSIPAKQKIPDSVPYDMKHLLQKFPSILRTGDVTPTPTHGVEHHIIMGSHPPVFANPVAWIRKNGN